MSRYHPRQEWSTPQGLDASALHLAGMTALGVVLAAVALVDLGRVIHRKRRGEPG